MSGEPPHVLPNLGDLRFAGIKITEWLLIGGVFSGLAMGWQTFRTQGNDQEKLAQRIEVIAADASRKVEGISLDLARRSQEIADTAAKAARELDLRTRANESKLEQYEYRFQAAQGRGEKRDERITDIQQTTESRLNALSERITTLDRGAIATSQEANRLNGEIKERLTRIECRLDPDCRSQAAPALRR